MAKRKRSTGSGRRRKSRARHRYDFKIVDHGSVVGFEPLTTAARKFAQEGLYVEPWQWLGRSFMVDRRVAENLVEFLAEQGFSVGAVA